MDKELELLEKKVIYMKKWFIWTAILSALAFVVLFFIRGGAKGILEPTLGGEIMKYVFGWVWVTVVLEVLIYTIAQFIYHWKEDYKEKYGKHWFREGAKKDWQYIKSQTTWKSVGRIVAWFIGFFAVVALVIYLLEKIVP